MSKRSEFLMRRIDHLLVEKDTPSTVTMICDEINLQTDWWLKMRKDSKWALVHGLCRSMESMGRLMRRPVRINGRRTRAYVIPYHRRKKVLDAKADETVIKPTPVPPPLASQVVFAIFDDPKERSQIIAQAWDDIEATAKDVAAIAKVGMTNANGHGTMRVSAAVEKIVNRIRAINAMEGIK